MTRESQSRTRRETTRRASKAVDVEFSSERMAELYPRVLQLARRLVGNEYDAEDVVQEAVLKALQHLRDYRGEAMFSTWLFRITWNQSMEFHRKRSKEVVRLGGIWQSQSRHPCLLATLSETPEQICRAKEMEDLLDRSLHRLTPCYRVPWVMRDMECLSYAEIAKQLGLSVSTVKVRIHRARRQLRRLVIGRLSRPTASERHLTHPCSTLAAACNPVYLAPLFTVGENPAQAAA